MREGDEIQEHRRERAYLSAQLEEVSKELARLDLLNFTLTRQKKQALTAFHLIRILHERLEQAFSIGDLYYNAVAVLTSELCMDACAVLKINHETREISTLASVGLRVPENIKIKLDKGFTKEEFLVPTVVNSKSSLRPLQEFIRSHFSFPYFVWYPIVDEENGTLVFYSGNKFEDLVSRQPFSEESLETFGAISSVILLRRDNIAKTREILRKKEERIDFLAEILKTSPISVVATDKEENITYCNPALEKLLGYKEAELLGKHPAMLNAEPNAAAIEKEIQDTVRRGGVWRGEIQCRKKNGDLFYNHLSVYQVRDREGNFIAMVGFQEDVSDRKRAEEALKESEEKFRSLAEQSPNMIFINKNALVIYANAKCEEVMGYKREEFYSPDFDFFTLIAPECVEVVKSSFTRHMNGEEVAPYEYTIVTKEGKRIEAIISANLVTYGAERAILGTVTDITERRRAEEAIKRRNAELSVLNTIGCTVSHSLELDAILDETLGKLLELLPIDIAAIRLVSDDVWRLPAANNCEALRQLIQAISLEEPLLKPVLDKGKPVILPRDPTNTDASDQAEGDGNLVLIPLPSQNMVHGVLAVRRQAGSPFCPDEVELLTTIGSQVGIAVHNAWLYRELINQRDFSLTLIETMPDGMGVIDEKGRLEFGNQRLFQLLGHRVGESLGAHWTSFFHPDDHDLVRAQARSGRNAKCSTYECRQHRKDGTTFPVLISWTPRLDDGGEYTGALGIVTDMTERKRAEEELKEYGARYTHLLDQMPDGVALTRQRRIVRANPSLALMFGYPSPHEMEGIFLWDMAAPGSKMTMRRQSTLRDLGPQGKNRFELQALRADGAVFPAEVTLTVDQGRTRPFVLALIRDVSEREEHTQLRRRLSEQILRAQEGERSSIARELHDELGQALTGIKMDMAWIKSRVKGTDGAISERFEFLGNLIDTTIESVRKMASDLRPSVLDRLGLTPAVEWYAAEFDRRTGIKCILESESSEFKIDDHIAINAYRILQEALTNVARHSGASRVSIRMAQDEGCLALSISDNGMGIPPHKRSGLESLGIAGMHERAELVKGRLDIQSRRGKGTKVTVYLPTSP